MGRGVVADAASNPALTSAAAPVQEPGGSGVAEDCVTDVSGSGAPYTVVLAPATTYILGQVDNYWFGPDGLPPISDDVTIDGNGATIERASTCGTPAFRFFYVSGGISGIPAGSLTRQDLTLSNGLAQGGSTNNGGGGGGAGLGGAVFDQGTLALARVTLSDPQVQSRETEIPGCHVRHRRRHHAHPQEDDQLGPSQEAGGHRDDV